MPHLRKKRNEDEQIPDEVMSDALDEDLDSKVRKEVDYALARRAERTGRYEEAALFYEGLAERYDDEKLFDKAKELREIARSPHIKVTSVNINELINQLNRIGFAVSYRCPNCSANLDIKDEKVPSECEYCGSKIEKVNLPDIIKKALS
jgi:rRNA maturation endonuclease Nob1